jgi:shikimate kinase
MQFADLDEEIEIREGRSVREIFASDGEAGFRAIEMRTLESLLREPDVDSTVLLIALGGGTLTDAGSRELVRRHTKCIYLRASAETLAAHLREAGTDGRPLLALKQGETLEGRIRSMLSARSAIYESCADAVADIDGLGIEEIANIINDIIK